MLVWAFCKNKWGRYTVALFFCSLVPKAPAGFCRNKGDRFTTVGAEKLNTYRKIVEELSFRNLTYLFADLRLIQISSGICNFLCLEHGPTELHILLSGEVVFCKSAQENYMNDRRVNLLSNNFGADSIALFCL